MKITGMDQFQDICKAKLAAHYNKTHEHLITTSDVFVVWSCKTLQNYKALLSTTVSGDGCYVEYTYNGDKGELYEDFYKKESNICYKA